MLSSYSLNVGGGVEGGGQAVWFVGDEERRKVLVVFNKSGIFFGVASSLLLCSMLLFGLCCVMLCCVRCQLTSLVSRRRTCTTAPSVTCRTATQRHGGGWRCTASR